MTNNNTALIADMLRQSMANGQTPFLTISSNSMAPLLKTGDQVGLEQVENSQLRLGDIITLVQDEYLLTHRFWGLGGDDWLRTRGDRPLDPDAPHKSGSLLGRVIIRRRSDRELALHTGAGRRLNRLLAWLVRLESRLLTGNRPDTSRLPPEKQRALPIRLVRRAFFVGAVLMVKVFSRLAEQKHIQAAS